jgi:hypothetical protein
MANTVTIDRRRYALEKWSQARKSERRSIWVTDSEPGCRGRVSVWAEAQHERDDVAVA